MRRVREHPCGHSIVSRAGRRLAIAQPSRPFAAIRRGGQRDQWVHSDRSDLARIMIDMALSSAAY